MLKSFAHFLRWLPYRFSNRIRACFAPKGLDFSDKTVQHGYSYMPTNRSHFHQCMSYLLKHFLRKEEISFIDIGCGKGLTLFYAKQMKFKNVGGLEYSSDLVSICRRNLALANIEDVELIQKDAATMGEECDVYNVFFLFNPFGPDIMRPFMDRLLESLQRRPREIFLGYYLPTCASIITEKGGKIVGDFLCESPYRHNVLTRVLVYQFSRNDS